jgi:hypothetical protein
MNRLELLPKTPGSWKGIKPEKNPASAQRLNPVQATPLEAERSNFSTALQ